MSRTLVVPFRLLVSVLCLTNIGLAACSLSPKPPRPTPTQHPFIPSVAYPTEVVNKPIAHVTEVEGDVFVTDPSASDLPGQTAVYGEKPARPFQPLSVNAVLRTASGARATVACVTNRVFTVSGASAIKVNEGCEFGKPMPPTLVALAVGPGVGRVMRVNSWILKARTRDKLRDYGRIPVVIDPRNTRLLTQTPTVQWAEVPGAIEYRIVFNNPDRAFELQVDSAEVVCVESELTAPYHLCSWPWSFSGQSLSPDEKYYLTVGARLKITEDFRKSEESLLVEPSSSEQIAKVRQEADNIRALNLDEFTESLLLAELYAEDFVYNEAIVAVERALKTQPTPIVYNTLGDAYREIGLYRWANNAYEQALQLLETEGDDPAVRATAEYGIGEVYFWYEDNYVEAEKHYAAAAQLYQQLGAQATEDLEFAQKGIEESKKRQQGG